MVKEVTITMQIIFILAISIFILGLTYFKAYDDGFKDGIEYNSLKSGTATKTREDNNLII